MVMICAGTSIYNVTLDLCYHWMMQKRFQCSHLANDEQAAAVNDLIIAKKVASCLSATYAFDDIGHAHQWSGLMLDPFASEKLIAEIDAKRVARRNDILALIDKHAEEFAADDYSKINHDKSTAVRDEIEALLEKNHV